MMRNRTRLVCMMLALLSVGALWSGWSGSLESLFRGFTVSADRDVRTNGPGAPIGDATQTESACSPPPQCFTDRDCNRICGKKKGGVCVVINSCYRECSCLLDQ